MKPQLPGRTGFKFIVILVVLALFSTMGATPARGAIMNTEERGNFLLLDTLSKIDLTGEELTLGTPSLFNLLTNRLQTLTNPQYWENYLYEALVGGTLVLPVPLDLLKPELVLPTATIKAGGEVWPLPHKPVDLSGVTYQWNGRTKAVRDFLINTETDIIAFVHRGNLIYDDYANGWSPEMRHQIWSVTKSFTSALVGIAEAEGKIDSVRDPIEKYIKELEGTVWEGVAIENLLQMESGIFWEDALCQPLQWVAMIVDLLTGGIAGMDRNDFLKRLPRVAEPGEQYQYSSGDTQVLAWLVETVYDRPYNELLSEKIWIPAGMEVDAEIMTDRHGNAIASMGIFCRPYDLARFGELYRNNGRNFAGKQIIPFSWINRSVRFTATSEYSYGYQWREAATDDGFQGLGFQGQHLTVSPGAELTGVRLSHNLGLRLRTPNSNPFDLANYEPANDEGGAEWFEVNRAVIAYLNSLEKEDDDEKKPGDNGGKKPGQKDEPGDPDDDEIIPPDPPQTGDPGGKRPIGELPNTRGSVPYYAVLPAALAVMLLPFLKKRLPCR